MKLWAILELLSIFLLSIRKWLTDEVTGGTASFVQTFIICIILSKNKGYTETEKHIS